MMPGEGNILPEDEFAVIADPATYGKIRCGRRKKIGTAAGGKADVPHFVGTKTSATAKSGMFKTSFSDAPRFRPRCESGVLHFRGVIESPDGAGNRDPARVA